MELGLTFIALLILAFWVMGIFSKGKNSSLAETASDYFSTQIKVAKADALIDVQNNLTNSDVKIGDLSALSLELKKL